jgi:hypothetical protein
MFSTLIYIDRFFHQLIEIMMEQDAKVLPKHNLTCQKNTKFSMKKYTNFNVKLFNFYFWDFFELFRNKVLSVPEYIQLEGSITNQKHQ